MKPKYIAADNVPLHALSPARRATWEALSGRKLGTRKRPNRSRPAPSVTADAIVELTATYRKGLALLSHRQISLSAAVLLYWLSFKEDFEESLIALDPNCTLKVDLSDRLRAIVATSTAEEIADLATEMTSILWERQHAASAIA